MLPSQPTMSRLLDALSGDANQAVVREAISELALRRLWMSNKRRRRKRLMIDVDGLPVQVHGQQPAANTTGTTSSACTTRSWPVAPRAAT